MKKALKILLYSSIILFIIFLFVSQEPTKQDEVTKVVSEKIEKNQEIPKEINQQPTVNAGDEGAETEDNVTINVGYWVLERVEVNNESIEYEYNKDKKIIKKMIDNNQDGKADRIYYYDDKGRETFSAVYNNGMILDKNISSQFTDDGKLKEKNTVFHYNDKVDYSLNIKKIYNEKGNILKEIGIKKFSDEIDDSSMGYKYEKKYYYNDTEQLLEVIGISNGKKYLHEEYKYEDERLLSKRVSDREGIYTGENYIYEDGVLKEVYHIRDTYYGGFHEFYNGNGLVKEMVEGAKKIKYIYDEENQLIVEKREAKEKYFFYNEDGEKIQEDHYEKDIDGEFKKVSYTLFDKEKTQKISLIDDSVETTYIENFYSGQIVIHDRRDVYDRYGNLIEIWDDATGKLIEKRFYRFVVANIK